MELASYEDFAKLDIRVAKVTDAKPIEGKTRIMEGASIWAAATSAAW